MPRVRVASFLFRCALLVLPAAACASQPSPTPLGAEPAPASVSAHSDADVCHTIALTRARCGEGVPVEAAERRCHDGFRPILSVARPDFLASIAACTRELDCDAVLQRDGIAACFHRPEPALLPTPTAREFCERSLDKARGCQRGSVMTEATCVRRLRIYRDDLLRAANDCTRLACGPWDACLKRALAVDAGDTQPPL